MKPYFYFRGDCNIQIGKLAAGKLGMSLRLLMALYGTGLGKTISDQKEPYTILHVLSCSDSHMLFNKLGTITLLG